MGFDLAMFYVSTQSETSVSLIQKSQFKDPGNRDEWLRCRVRGLTKLLKVMPSNIVNSVQRCQH